MKKRILSFCAALTMLVSVSTILKRDDFRGNAADRQLNIEVCFDITETTKYSVPNAFRTRYDRITSRVAAVYKGAFNINLNFTQPTQNYVVSSPASTCRSGQNFDALCTHATNTACSNTGPYHCTNAWYNLTEMFYGKLTVNKRYMLLTASALCLKNDTTNVHSTAYGLNAGFSGSNNVIVRDYDYTNVDNVSNWLGDYEHIDWVSKTVAHEIGHFYEVVDHYNVCYGDDRDNCIWGYNKEDQEVCAEFQMCDTCYNTIRSNCNDFNHS